MSRRMLGVGIVVAAALVAGSFALSCSSNKNSNPTSPGGGGGLELNSGNIGGGGVFPHTFNTAGTFNYHCTIHGLGMAGAVTVVASGAPTAVSMDIFNNGYTVHGSPGTPNGTVMVGGTVTWTNTGTTHTVTSN